VDFARQWGPQEFHLDAAAARASPYGGLVASGFHTMLTAFVLMLEAEIRARASMGSPGVDDIRWLQPARPGDTLRAEGTVVASTPSRSRRDCGRMTIRRDMRDPSGEVVRTHAAIHILRRCPDP